MSNWRRVYSPGAGGTEIESDAYNTFYIDCQKKRTWNLYHLETITLWGHTLHLFNDLNKIYYVYGDITNEADFQVKLFYALPNNAVISKFRFLDGKIWTLDIYNNKLITIEPGLLEVDSKTVVEYCKDFVSPPIGFGYISSTEIYVLCEGCHIDLVDGLNSKTSWFRANNALKTIATGESITTHSKLFYTGVTLYNIDIEVEAGYVYVSNVGTIRISDKTWYSSFPGSTTYVRTGGSSFSLGSVILRLIQSTITPKYRYISYNVSGVRKYFDLTKYLKSEQLDIADITGTGNRFRTYLTKGDTGFIDSDGSHVYRLGYPRVHSGWYLSFREMYNGTTMSNLIYNKLYIDFPLLVNFPENGTMPTDKTSWIAYGGFIQAVKEDGTVLTGIDLDCDIYISHIQKLGSVYYYNYRCRVIPHSTEYRFMDVGLVRSGVYSNLRSFIVPPKAGYKITCGGFKLKSTTYENYYKAFYLNNYSFLTKKPTSEVLVITATEDDKMLMFRDYIGGQYTEPHQLCPAVGVPSTYLVNLGRWNGSTLVGLNCLTGLLTVRNIQLVRYWFGGTNNQYYKTNKVYTYNNGWTLVSSTTATGASANQLARQYRTRDIVSGSYSSWADMSVPSEQSTLWAYDGIAGITFTFNTEADCKSYLEKLLGTAGSYTITITERGYFTEDVNISSPYDGFTLEGNLGTLIPYDYGGT